MQIGADGTLRFVFDDTQWGSTMTFDPTIEAVVFDGTLDFVVDLDKGLNIQDLLGVEFQLFSYVDVLVDGRFASIHVGPAYHRRRA